jgi:iron complex transport system ATP-binding protein
VLLGRFPQAPAWLGWQHDDETVAHAALTTVGLADFAARRYATLSGGERQRVRIAQLLAQAPHYLLLDEPLQHLDLRYQIEMLDLLAALARDPQQARGVVIVLHDVLWPARVCTHALLLDGGGSAQAGTAREVLTQANLEALFGCALQPAGDKPEAGFVPAI